MRISSYCPFILLLFALCSCEENDLISCKQEAQAEQQVPKNTATKLMEIHSNKIEPCFFYGKPEVDEYENNRKNE